MNILLGFIGVVIIAVVLFDTFETIVLPRRVVGRIRLTRLFYRVTWVPWRTAGSRIPAGNRRENFLSFYGPISLLMLIVFWALLLVLGFALIQFAIGPSLTAPEKSVGFGTCLYMSGTTFFTLGFGDVVPVSGLARVVSVWEGGTGFAMLGLTVSYLPTLYQSFSKREVNISLLDARAGSPPTALELIRRHCSLTSDETLKDFLKDWELWAAEILESHLSYPVLAYYRSQHENQSWLSSLTFILDVCALILAATENTPRRAAELTFAMARHAAVDLSQIFGIKENIKIEFDRLPPPRLLQLQAALQNVGVQLRSTSEIESRLTELRNQYEPYIEALSNYLLMSLPEWLPADETSDNWQKTAWLNSNDLSLF